MALSTADLCDKYDKEILVAAPLFHSFGGVKAFYGPIVAVRAVEDNSLVRVALEQPGNKQVLVVDGGGSKNCALLGDQLAQLMQENDWAGAIVYGCIRDSRQIADMPVGVKALTTHPRKSLKRGLGDKDVPVNFAGVTFNPGHYVYADEDGIIVAPRNLLADNAAA